jgi:hypothetical protein
LAGRYYGGQPSALVFSPLARFVSASTVRLAAPTQRLSAMLFFGSIDHANKEISATS